MAEYQQESRRIAVNTPLGKDVLLLTSVEGDEEFSRLFCYRLQMLSTEDAIDPKKIVGKNVAVSLAMDDKSVRYINGYVSRFRYRGRGDRLSLYSAEIVPWFWFLTQTSDCRIFQDKSAVQIIEQIFSDMGFNDFELKINGNHPKREYCVQYRETDFSFISRLMEAEGIFYYFRHEKDKHVMVLSDHKGGYYECPDAQVQFLAPLSASEITDQITQWEHQYEFRPGKWTQTDYDFQNPSNKLLTKVNTLVQFEGNAGFEHYDYPGNYADKSFGQALTKIRMEADEVPHDMVVGASRCRGFSPGAKFKITRHHCESEEGKTYVVTAVSHSAGGGGYVTGGEVAEGYSNTFRCIRADATYRPPRDTPRPIIHGSQTAIVVGTDGEDIHVDEFGRARVQFHWDRDGKRDEKSSCWMRVVHPHVGGTLFLPRVGHEVVVTFLEGDPDQPIITGRVYNKDNMPPYALPDFQTITTIKTATEKGQGFNEIRLDDKKGEEQVFIHAEKNQDIRVKNDCFEWIGNDRHLIVTANQFEHVEANRHEKVDADHLEQIGKDRHLSVKGKEAKAVTDSLSLKVQGNVIHEFGANHSEKTGGNYYLKAAGVVIEGAGGITLKCGGNSVVIDPTGVTVKGSLVTIDGSMTKINSGPGSPPTPGAAGSLVAPTAPTAPQEADDADPVKVTKARTDQREEGKGKYATTEAVPFKPGKGIGTDEEKKKNFIAIKVVDKDGHPVAGEPYKIILPDGKEYATGATDDKGCAKVEGVDAGQCKVILPLRDKTTWKSK